jgi:transcriptional regulator with XRE-family HTH domain
LSTIEDKILLRMAGAIRSRRTHLSLTVRALAKKSGVSSSMISDVERGAKSPTISTLSALAAALGISVAALIEKPRTARKGIHVRRATDRKAVVNRVSGARQEPLDIPLAGSRITFLRYTVPPRALAGPFPAHLAGTIEHIHLVSGRLRFVLGKDTVLLAAGDSCVCIADAPHSFDNRESPAEAVLYLVTEL